jgi:hypothetical protein
MPVYPWIMRDPIALVAKGVRFVPESVQLGDLEVN